MQLSGTLRVGLCHEPKGIQVVNWDLQAWSSFSDAQWKSETYITVMHKKTPQYHVI